MSLIISREQGTGNREQVIGNRESGIGNRESGIGNREKYLYLFTIQSKDLAYALRPSVEAYATIIEVPKANA
ncbi:MULTISPECIES: hypothetical protein [Moorena]|uniref:Uncharacterized protein n=1 Tax=Moorena producens 3L TaxID=489825 RepID=F4XZG4_9CYAN|nr:MULTISPECIES: hypothetical protein [Moorena]NEQ17935.1 hypothetical protein [Moorena sp. SIO3E2]EGJ29969.1 hypothetical protein LYNGBM3L_57490 [Moorena producens 3L]NEP33288.1 hypothetical protein [Moorena sp. SIO3B2]NEP66882.1 hypothetical protein [Moorena sp. SIO3A5]NEQ06002.1 hypothetical protein [Moorena sp. SIO4E2]